MEPASTRRWVPMPPREIGISACRSCGSARPCSAARSKSSRGPERAARSRPAFPCASRSPHAKKAADVELLTAIRAVHQGRSFVDLTRPGEPAPGQQIGRVSRDSPRTGHPRPLSRREAEVLRLLAQGYTNQEAADRLAVSVKTIETHRKRLSDKLGLKSRAQLFRFAVEGGLLQGE